MSRSCGVAVTRARLVDLHQRWHSVEYTAAIDELKLRFPAVVHAAKHGTQPQVLAQMAKDIGDGQNQLCRSLVRYHFGAQDAGIPTDVVLDPLHAAIALVCARAPSRVRSVDELLAIETKLESEINPIQWAFAQDRRNGFLRRRLIEKLRRYIRNALEMLESLEREEAEEVSRKKYGDPQ